MPPSSLEAKFLRLWDDRAITPDAPDWVKDLPDPVHDRRFHGKRMWRFDYSWEGHRVAVELEGGVISVPVTCNHCRRPVIRFDKRTKTKRRVYAVMGGHTTTEGYRRDCVKYNAAAGLGWRVLRYTAIDIEHSPILTIQEVCRLLHQGKVAGVADQLSLF